MYYYTDSSNQAKGPVSLEDLQAFVNAGTLNASTMVAEVGSQQWNPIGTVIPSLATAVGAPPLPPTGSKNEPLAIWSFVLSLVGLLCCGFFAAIPAIICGHLAISKIGKTPGAGGKGFALAGLIIGYISLIGWISYIFFGGAAAMTEILNQSMRH